MSECYGPGCTHPSHGQFYRRPQPSGVPTVIRHCRWFVPVWLFNRVMTWANRKPASMLRKLARKLVGYDIDRAYAVRIQRWLKAYRQGKVCL